MPQLVCPDIVLVILLAFLFFASLPSRSTRGIRCCCRRRSSFPHLARRERGGDVGSQAAVQVLVNVRSSVRSLAPSFGIIALLRQAVKLAQTAECIGPADRTYVQKSYERGEREEEKIIDRRSEQCGLNIMRLTPIEQAELAEL